ncbi:hypothetical protein ACJX0J_026694, partial [Zea mays]
IAFMRDATLHITRLFTIELLYVIGTYKCIFTVLITSTCSGVIATYYNNGFSDFRDEFILYVFSEYSDFSEVYTICVNL